MSHNSCYWEILASVKQKFAFLWFPLLSLTVPFGEGQAKFAQSSLGLPVKYVEMLLKRSRLGCRMKLVVLRFPASTAARNGYSVNAHMTVSQLTWTVFSWVKFLEHWMTPSSFKSLWFYIQTILQIFFHLNQIFTLSLMFSCTIYHLFLTYFPSRCPLPSLICHDLS